MGILDRFKRNPIDELKLSELREEETRLKIKLEKLREEINKLNEMKKRLFEEGIGADLIKKRMLAEEIKQLDMEARIKTKAFMELSEQYKFVSNLVTVKKYEQELKKTMFWKVLMRSSPEELEMALIRVNLARKEFKEILNELEKLGRMFEVESAVGMTEDENENLFEAWDSVEIGIISVEMAEKIVLSGMPKFSELEKEADPPNLDQILVSTPLTLRQLPQKTVDVYFYYFTDEFYSSESSKYRLLDEVLGLFGRYRAGLEVIIIDRDRIPLNLWEAMLAGLEIKKYPALVVSSYSLGIENLSINSSCYNPPKVSFAKLESGFIADKILEDRDKLIKLLNELYDAAREKRELSKSIRKETIIEMLKLVGKDVKDILVNKVF